jgi:hypothetical protein
MIAHMWRLPPPHTSIHPSIHHQQRAGGGVVDGGVTNFGKGGAMCFFHSPRAMIPPSFRAVGRAVCAVVMLYDEYDDNHYSNIRVARGARSFIKRIPHGATALCPSGTGSRFPRPFYVYAVLVFPDYDPEMANLLPFSR